MISFPTWLFLSALTVASVPAGIAEWAQNHHLNLLKSRESTSGGKKTSEVFYDLQPEDGKIYIKYVRFAQGGGGVLQNFLRYDMIYPKDNQKAVDMLKDYSQQDALNSLTAKQLNTCFVAVQKMKSPQIKTVFWQVIDPVGQLLVKVNCGVTATGSYITYEEKAF